MADENIVKLLMNYKPDLNAKDKFGKTPLQWAKERKKSNIIKIIEKQ